MHDFIHALGGRRHPRARVKPGIIIAAIIFYNLIKNHMSFKFTLGLLVGAAAGIAIANFLQTEEGKNFLRKLKRDAAGVEEDLVNLGDDLIKKGEAFVGEMGGNVERPA